MPYFTTGVHVMLVYTANRQNVNIYEILCIWCILESPQTKDLDHSCFNQFKMSFFVVVVVSIKTSSLAEQSDLAVSRHSRLYFTLISSCFLKTVRQRRSHHLSVDLWQYICCFRCVIGPLIAAEYHAYQLPDVPHISLCTWLAHLFNTRK